MTPANLALVCAALVWLLLVVCVVWFANGKETI